MALAALHELLAHPCAQHQVSPADVLHEIHQLLRRLRRFDEAIQAKRDAIAAGYRSNPDPEADIAETLVEAGRREEADALYAELLGRNPDDVWLYNSAGYIYGGVDDAESLRWILSGIEVAISTGDYDQVIGQLLGMAREQWDVLGQSADDELIGSVESFQQSWVRPPRRPTTTRADGPPEPAVRRCTYCGFDPDTPPQPAAAPAPSGPPPQPPVPPRQPPPASGSGRSAPATWPREVAVSLAWFPAGEWPAAIERWPDLLDYLPADHLAYSHRIEARLKWMVKHTPGQSFTVSPMSVDELVKADGDDAGSGEARSRLAAEVARTGRALTWPPARNDACWCGSGSKYKRCCGPTPPAED